MGLLPYRQILRQAAIRVTAITGTTASALESAYITSPLTTVQVGNTDFTLSVIKDALVDTVGRIVRAYADVPNHPFRVNNISQTSALASGALLPSTNSASKPIVGAYGAIRSNAGAIMTEQPEQIIQTIIDDTDNHLLGTYNYYKIVSERIIHTATTVTIDVCTFSATDEFTAIGANGNAPIPDTLLDVAVAGLLGWLIVDDEFVGQAQAFNNYFEKCLADMQQGKTAYLPAPVLMNSQQSAIS